ncbi:response regulator [Flavobacteriaceae bacterium R38]|nr:response regulator [Flavobacteriaceae bacterium R38]
MNNSSIIIADDHPLLLKGLHDFLIEKNYNVIDSANNGTTAYELIEQHQPSIAVLDIQMPGMSGIEVAKKCQKNNLKTKIILITLHKEKDLFLEAKNLNVSGYVLKEFAIEEIEICLEAVIKDKSYFSPKITELLKIEKDDSSYMSLLTPSEKKILKLISNDKTNKEIADLLFISVRTVEKHRSNIISKLDLNPRTNSLLIWAKEHRDLLSI